MRKEPTIEEWKKIGAKAKEVRANLNELHMLLSDKLPLYQYENKLDNAEKAFGKLRTHLDNLVINRFPDHPDEEITHIFFGIDERK